MRDPVVRWVLLDLLGDGPRECAQATLVRIRLQGSDGLLLTVFAVDAARSIPEHVRNTKQGSMYHSDVQL